MMQIELHMCIAFVFQARASNSFDSKKTHNTAILVFVVHLRADITKS